MGETQENDGSIILDGCLDCVVGVASSCHLARVKEVIGRSYESRRCWAVHTIWLSLLTSGWDSREDSGSIIPDDRPYCIVRVASSYQWVGFKWMVDLSY